MHYWILNSKKLKFGKLRKFKHRKTNFLTYKSFLLHFKSVFPLVTKLVECFNPRQLGKALDICIEKPSIKTNLFVGVSIAMGNIFVLCGF